MNEVLVDTTVWIDFFNGVNSPECEILINYIREDYPVYICPVILQEILQGFIDDSDFKKAKVLLLEFPILKDNPIEISISAAELYRSIRKRGKTIRKSNDCLIAAYCIKNRIPVLHRNRDFTMIARYSNLKTVTKS